LLSCYYSSRDVVLFRFARLLYLLCCHRARSHVSSLCRCRPKGMEHLLLERPNYNSMHVGTTR
jgi:hypothetical protein